MKWFIQDIKEAKYSEEVEKGVLQFVNDLIDGRIVVRAHNSKAIHAKFYLFLPEHHIELKLPTDTLFYGYFLKKRKKERQDRDKEKGIIIEGL